MGDPETRIVDPITGGAKGSKLARFDLLPVQPLFEVARLYGRGAEKYEARNWEKAYAWSMSFAAMMRHAWQFWGGESVDAETERHHLASVIFHAMALMEFERRQIGTDDRSPQSPRPLLKPEIACDCGDLSIKLEHRYGCPRSGLLSHEECNFTDFSGRRCSQPRDDWHHDSAEYGCPDNWGLRCRHHEFQP